MGSKIKRALKKSKFVWIVVAVMWIALSIIFVAPLSVTIADAASSDDFMQVFMDDFLINFTDIGGNFEECFSEEYRATYLKGELYLTIVLIIVAFYGVMKTLPKNEYTDIEHGSSDWARGEQYDVLSNKKGIILAEKHYLPVDKRGNVNVLVVGRFRFW